MNPIQILQVLDSVQSYSDIWGASYNICRHIYSDDFWELPRDVTSLTVKSIRQCRQCRRGVGRGVALLYRSFCLIWMPLKFPPHPHSLLSLCKKGQGFPRHSIAVVPELCLFHHPKNLFFCDINFYTSCNIFQEYLVPVPYVILLFRIFSDMFTCTIDNISMYSKKFPVLLNKNYHSAFSIFLSSFLNCITNLNIAFF